MAPESLRADLLEIGLTDEAFACFVGEDVRVVRQWLSGDAAIPSWLGMSVCLVQAFVAGIRKGSKGSGANTIGRLISASELQEHLARRNVH